MPRPLQVGEQQYRALPLRLSDLGVLEALACESWPDPSASLPAEDAPDDPAFRKAIRDACDALEYHWPWWGSIECQTLTQCTPLGQATLLAAVLRLDGVTLDGALGMLPEANWDAVCGIAFGADRLRQLVQRIDRVIGAPTIESKGTTWAEAICGVAREMGLPPAELGTWTIPEFNMMASGGAIDPWGVPPPNSNEYAAFRQQVAPLRLAFFREGKQPKARPEETNGHSAPD